MNKSLLFFLVACVGVVLCAKEYSIEAPEFVEMLSGVPEMLGLPRGEDKPLRIVCTGTDCPTEALVTEFMFFYNITEGEFSTVDADEIPAEDIPNGWVLPDFGNVTFVEGSGIADTEAMIHVEPETPINILDRALFYPIVYEGPDLTIETAGEAAELEVHAFFGFQSMPNEPAGEVEGLTLMHETNFMVVKPPCPPEQTFHCGACVPDADATGACDIAASGFSLAAFPLLVAVLALLLL